MVRSRKRKAMQPEGGRRVRSMVSEQRGGRFRVRDQRAFEGYGRGARFQSASRQEGAVMGPRVPNGIREFRWHEDRRNVDQVHAGETSDDMNVKGGIASFYFTNFPDSTPVFQLRQSFEVCGILSDVYLARKRNFRGQSYGFLRFLNVKNRDKLAFALNNVWIGQCCIWAREARYDRFVSVARLMWRVRVMGGRRKVKVRLR